MSVPSQMLRDLFKTAPQTFAGIPCLYYSRVIPKKASEEMYKQLDALVPKTFRKLVLFGKTVQESTSTQYFSKDHAEYRYSNSCFESGGWPEPVAYLSTVAYYALIANGYDGQSTFDSALIKHYASGDAKLGMHKDKDAMSGFIASFSFGVTRVFRILDNNKKEVLRVPLEDGSLFIMMPGFQQKYYHEILGTKKVKDSRINVTLRQHQYRLVGKAAVIEEKEMKAST